MLAASADRAGDSSKGHAGAGTASRSSEKQDKDESKTSTPGVDSQTATPLPSPGLIAPVQNVSSGEGNSNLSSPPSSGSSVQDFPLSAPEASGEVSQGMVTAAPTALGAPDAAAGTNGSAAPTAVAAPSVGADPNAMAGSNAVAGTNAAAPTAVGAQNAVVGPTPVGPQNVVAGPIAVEAQDSLAASTAGGESTAPAGKISKIAVVPMALPATSDSGTTGGQVQQDPANTPSASAQSGTDPGVQPAGLVALQSMGLQMPPQVPQNFAGSGTSSLPIGKAIQKDSSQAVHQKNSDPGSANDVGKSKSTDSSDGSTDATGKNAQTNNQAGQHSQNDASAVAVVVQKADDSGSPQQQSVASHVASHVADVGPRAADGGTNTLARSERSADAASTPVDGEAPVTPSSVHLSNLMQTMSGSEMRVGMHSSEFGNISIRTTVSQQQMLTQISLDHSDLSQAISAHAATCRRSLATSSGFTHRSR